MFDKKIKRLNEQINRLERIIRYSKPNEITFVTYSPLCTYIYKNNREYIIDGVALYNPKFVLSDESHVVYAYDEDNDRYIDYVIDLVNEKFIVTKLKWKDRSEG